MLARTRQVAKDLYQAYNNWEEDDGTHYAASVSFYIAISFFPLIMVLLSLTGAVLGFTGWGRDARQRLLNLIADQTAPVVAEQIDAILENLQQGAAVSGPIGLLTLLFLAVTVFVHFDSAMDRMWNVRRPDTGGVISAIRRALVDRLRAFLILMGVGGFALAGFFVNMVLSGAAEFAERLPLHKPIWTTVTFATAVGLNWLLLTVVYRAIPKVPVRWSEAARGALFAALMWEIGRRILAAYVIGSRYSVYGIVGAFVAVMLWIFYAVTILFLGAEYIQVFCAECNRRAPPYRNATKD